MKTQRLLAIETSSPRLSLALGTETQVLKAYQGPLQWRHADTLFDGMKNLMKKTHWPVQTLTGVLVSTGPGSFTGIRIGLATARTLGQALGIPVIGVPSLQTIAAGLLKPGRVVCSLIDALRGDVFAGVYAMNAKGQTKILLKEVRLPLAELIQKLKGLTREPPWFAGDAALLYRKQLKRAGGKHWHFAGREERYPKAPWLIKIAAARIAKSPADSYKKVLPLYLRSAAAQERRDL